MNLLQKYDMGYRYMVTFKTNSGDKSHEFCTLKDAVSDANKLYKSFGVRQVSLYELCKDKNGYVNAMRK